MPWRWLLVLLIAWGCWQWFSARPVSPGPGVIVTEAPAQTALERAGSFSFNGYQITPLADFSIRARVLSRKNYSLDRQSDLSPVDLALGWQQMSDDAVLAHLKITQSGRWYFWRVTDFPVPRRVIETQSANMHLIPADDEVSTMLSRIRQGDIVLLEGQLIVAEAPDGWRWQSSLSREDTGANACELVFVRKVSIVTDQLSTSL